MTPDSRPESDASLSTRRYGATASILTAVLATAGVLTYGFFALASHSLSAEDYGALVVLWSAVFIAVSVVFRPIEMLLSRTVSEREAHELEIGSTMRIAASIQLGLTLAFVAVGLIFRGPIEDQLLDGRTALYLVMLGTAIVYGGSYFARGLLAGQRRFGLYGALLMLESVGRLSFAVAVAIGIGSGVDLVALGVMVGPLLSLSVIPLALSRHDRPASAIPPSAERAGPGDFTLGHGSVFAASLFVALLCEQVLLTTGPLFVRDSEGIAAAGFMFNILLVARAPVLLFQAVAASLLPHLTRLRSSGDETGGEAFRLSVRLTIGVVVGFSAVVIAAVLAIGPQVMSIGFGDEFGYDRLGLALVAAGMGFYLAAATLNQAAVARGQARQAALCWLASAATFLLWILAGPGNVFRQVEIGFGLSAMVLCACLFVLYVSERSRAEDSAAPPVSL